MKTKGKKSNEGFEYQYFIKDHLGNTRVMLSQTGQVLQQNAYYPFGMLISMPQPDLVNQNKYLYNGKELQTDFGLDWYDYGARFYDAGLGRWHVVDPMASENSWVSPYNYCQNNPILRIDPDGALDTKYEDEEGNELLNTNDGSDAVVTVTDDKRKGFDAAVKGTENTDDVAWNNTMKKSLLGFELSAEQEGMLSQLNSDWSKKNAIAYWQNPTFGAAVAFSFSEALSQWTNPYLVVGGLSAGVAGYSATLKSVTSAEVTLTDDVPVHGNSLQSKRPTWGYKLYSKEGAFLKNGITSKPIPETRYSKSFMQDKYMGTKRLFPNRRAAYNWEYKQNLNKRGPLNKNMH